MSGPATILVIEGEPHARTLMVFTLRQEGYRCVQAGRGTEGIAAATDRDTNVVLLDIQLPDLEAQEVTRRIRENSAVPIIVLASCGQEQSCLAAIDAGASDFVTKPFSTAELLARIRVVLRGEHASNPEPESGVMSIGDILVNFGSRSVTVSGAEVSLTRTEYRLFSVLLRSAGKVIPSRQILREVWGAPYEDQTAYLRIYMQKLRYKVEREPSHPRYLITQRGIGYLLRVPA